MQPRNRYNHRRILLAAIVTALVLAAAYAAGQAIAQPPRPVKEPEALLRARRACPNTASIVQCRSALIRAITSVEWQKRQNIRLAREMLGKLTDWTCIHHGEAAWNDAGDPYWGGLQMDRAFMRTYGRDMIRKHHAWADRWSPREQIIVAQRAYAQNRGYNPWPNTSRACGLR